MQKIIGLSLLSSAIAVSSNYYLSATAQTASLFLAYPPPNHQTTANQIFLIGTAPPEGEVLINGKPIQRSQAGHFAPSFPLRLGENVFSLRYKNEEKQITITRTTAQVSIPQETTFATNSLTPQQDLSRLPNELICFSAVAPPNANVSVLLANQTIPLYATDLSQLPPNSAVLTNQNNPINISGQYQGCSLFSTSGNLGKPTFQLSLNGKTESQPSPANITILNPSKLEVIEVISEVGTTRTGPSTDYSRMTPLPKGTRAAVTGTEGEWIRLDYGAWIRRQETKTLANLIPPQSLIRGINSRILADATEVIFPLQTPVPVSVQQREQTFTLTLYNTTAQTDTIYLADSPIIKNLTWQQIAPQQIQYTFYLKSPQQWGYQLRYEGTNLILSLRHSPKLNSNNSTLLAGIKILLDPGHGGNELGSRGPTGYPEKDVNLVVSKLLQQELIKRGATVYMTRETDKDVSLEDRVTMIEKVKPDLALSVHYNALPDNGDAINTKGISMFWYQPQAQDLAAFLKDYLITKLQRPDYGVYWNNLALTRPYAAISILMELGFMINPNEFEWITNPQEQAKLATTIADGIVIWLNRTRLN